MVSVLFVFLVTTSYWALVQDLADSPKKASAVTQQSGNNAHEQIPEKLANALQGTKARNFMVSYVMLQGRLLMLKTDQADVVALGLMPLQLLNLGPLLTLGSARAFFTKTPRGMRLQSSRRDAHRPDYAEANAPPMLNYGWVYPQALLIFTITLVYSVVTPIILVFGALYFGAACGFILPRQDRSDPQTPSTSTSYSSVGWTLLARR